MQNPSLLARDDTFFGVCEGLAQDIGIHRNWLRLAFAALLFWNPFLAIGAYAAAGALVAGSRWLYPNPQPAKAAGDAEAAHEPLAPDAEPVPIAA